MALPVLVLVAAALAWVVCLGVGQVQVVDAARETARALARGDDPAEAIERGRRVAPGGAVFVTEERAGEVVVTVTARVRAAGGLLGGVPGFRARATAVASREDRG